jgi:hypothetical protein
MSRRYEASYRVDPSFYDAWHSGKSAGLVLPGCNAGRLAKGHPISTGCLGDAERILR